MTASIVLVIVVGLLLFHYVPKIYTELNEYLIKKQKQLNRAKKLRKKIK